MASSNKVDVPLSKTFRQKYRVFSAAFWQGNGASFDLERSDKLVLPPSALSALTDCNADFPVLLKVQNMDTTTNKALPSNMFSYVHDYSAPEGLLYMASWMIDKLSLTQSGQSVVELSLPTTSNLKYQCPTADFLQLEPHTPHLMRIDDAAERVLRALSEHYSSLRVGDTLSVWMEKETEMKLTVSALSGKDTAYTPKCVRIHNVDDTLMLGFSPPRNGNDNGNAAEVDVDAHNAEEEQKEQTEQREEKEENRAECEDEKGLEFEGEWEIVSVDRVQSLSELEWQEPKKAIESVKHSENENEKEADDDVKDIPTPIIIDESMHWLCPQCALKNESTYKFCPKCGCKKVVQTVIEEKSEPPKKKKKKAVVEDVSPMLLHKVSVINDGAYCPSEQRQTGWIVRNVSGGVVKCLVRMQRVGGDSQVKVEMEQHIALDVKDGDEVFVMCAVTAPNKPSQYHVFYQMVLAEDVSVNVCEMLQIAILVNSEFGEKKEKKIKRIHEMGFSERTKVITALKKWKWDELKAVNWLATH